MIARPPPGHYTAFLPPDLAHVRIPRTDKPIIGMVRRPDLVEKLALHFDGVKDEHAPYYADGLRSGALTVVVYPNASLARAEVHHADGTTTSGTPSADRVWAPGELFFGSTR